MIRFLVATSILATAIPLSAQEQKVLSDQMLPKETFAYFSMPSMSKLKDQFQSSGLGQLWADPVMDNFKAELSSALESDLDEGLAEFQETLGMTVEEFLQIPTGEISFAISGAPGNTMGAAIFIDFGDSELQVLNLLERAIAAISSNSKIVWETESFDGTDITMFRVQFNGPPPTPLVKEFGWFIKDQRLVISSRLELMQAILTNWSGSDASFMDNEAYASVLAICQTSDRSSLSTFFVDPVGLFTKLVQTNSLGQASMQAGMALGFLPTLGFSQMQAIGGVTQAGGEKFDLLSRSVFYAEQPPIALMRVMQLGEMDSTPPAWVKENVHMYAAMNWKLDDAFGAIEELVDLFSGQGALADQLNKLADQPPGIHIKHDIIDQLTGEVRLISAAGDNDTGGDDMLVVVSIRDESVVGALLTKIADRANLTTRDFRGVTIFEQAEGTGPVSVAVDNNRLMIGVGGSLLEQILRNDSDMRPLSEADDYRQVAENFPSSVLSVQFSRPALQYKKIYEMLQSGDAEQFPGSQELLEKIDFTTLPDFDSISKYVQPTGGFTVQSENGITMESFQLKPSP